MIQEIIRAVGLVLVIEGILPFLYPDRWRRMVAMLATVDNNNLRTVGLLSMVVGLGLLYLVWLI